MFGVGFFLLMVLLAVVAGGRRGRPGRKGYAGMADDWTTNPAYRMMPGNHWRSDD